MTLVVARRVGQNICVAADTSETNPKLVKQSVLTPVLKVVAVSPRSAVAFAGNIPLAYQAIARIRREVRDTSGHVELASLLLEEHRRGALGTDYLICTLTPEACISKISEGRVHSDLDAAYVGRQDAFAAFQRLQAEQKPFDFGERDERSSFRDAQMGQAFAMRGLVGSFEYEDVAGFAMQIASSRDRTFSYLMSSTTELRAETFDATPTTLQGSSAEEGAYSATVLTTRSHEPFVGIYFFEASFGVVLDARGEPSVTTLRVPRSAFVGAVLEQFGVNLSGIGFG